ncbi:MAG: methyltransferase domain-containing protein [Desulfobacterales bacterium]|nr:methyltransferase domain-containing protein [Desulfobacterales bacterium]
MNRSYIHGYDALESGRLDDQAHTLEELLHHDTCYPAGHRVLETGCGTGAQTAILARRSPGARITAVDIAADSLAAARKRLEAMAVANVHFHQADGARLPFADHHFDHVFVCFLLEHLARPESVLQELRRVLKPGGSLTVIEGDHGSFYCYPQTAAGRQVVRCLIDLQAACGGDALIGRRLYPLLYRARFEDVRVTPRVVYVDPSRPAWEEGFSRNTFIAMVSAVEKNAIDAGLIDPADWRQGIKDLKATIGRGTFHYTFFKALARGPRSS